jgi:hypothetical protein
MELFQQCILILAIIVFVIIIIFIFLSENNERYGHSWPPLRGLDTCPDYWIANSLSSCEMTNQNRNKKPYQYESDLGTGEKTNTLSNVSPTILHYSRDGEQSLDFSKATYCEKRQFAHEYDVVWNGISYGTPQDIDTMCPPLSKNVDKKKVDSGLAGFISWLFFFILVVYTIIYMLFYERIRPGLGNYIWLVFSWKYERRSEPPQETLPWRIRKIILFLEPILSLILAIGKICIIIAFMIFCISVFAFVSAITLGVNIFLWFFLGVFWIYSSFRWLLLRDTPNFRNVRHSQHVYRDDGPIDITLQYIQRVILFNYRFIDLPDQVKYLLWLITSVILIIISISLALTLNKDKKK